MAENQKVALICDDSLLVRKKLKELLEGCGCTKIIEASNGQEAVELYQVHKPDIVFLDIIMPVLDGLGALEKIKTFDERANVIMVSSAGTKTNLMDALKVGANDFIQKPYDKDQIAKLIKNI